jgi:hypothetical protein
MHGAVSFDVVGPPGIRSTLVTEFKKFKKAATPNSLLRSDSPLTTHAFSIPILIPDLRIQNGCINPPHTVAQHTSNKTTSSTTSKTFSRAIALEFLNHLVVVFGPPAAETTANHGRHTTIMSSSIRIPQAAAQSTSPEQGLGLFSTDYDTCSSVIACDRYNPAAYA